MKSKKLALIGATGIVILGGVAFCMLKKNTATEIPKETQTEATTEKETEEVISTTTEATTEEETETTTETKVDKSTASQTQTVEEGTKADGTFMGWADDNSVEVRLSTGKYLTLFVYNDEVIEDIADLEDGDDFIFIYGTIKGQGNNQILKII